jgi:hypothetical protein
MDDYDEIPAIFIDTDEIARAKGKISIPVSGNDKQ